MDTKALEKFCPWARAELIDAVHLRCMEFGLDDKGRAAFPAGSDMVAGNVLDPELKALRDAHYESIEHMGYDAFLEHQAYSWFNRFAAIRYMELHDFLPSHIRMVSSSTGDMYPDCVRAVAELELEGLNRAEAIDLAIAGENEKLYRSIILAQCRELAQALPSVFAGADELTLPNNLLGHGEHDVLHHLVADIPEEAWENVEVLGWMYQFYNSELKDNFFKSKRKAAVEDLAPATQLFTPDWIVRYMVENSLGRLWMLNNPGSRLREQMEYYIEPDEGHEDFIHVDGPEDITFCDPACGSGHILVYAFSLLFDMYLERGYREREIPELILTRNLTGLEIDERAAQIASLALALCAREHDRRFFTRGVTADVRVLRSVEFAEGELPETSALVRHKKSKLIESLAHLGEIGSLLLPDEGDLGCIRDDAETCAIAAKERGDLLLAGTAAKLAEAQDACEALSRTFDVVVANPPYMGSSSFNPFMGKWMKADYPDSCKDLCTAFIERGGSLAKGRGYISMVTSQSWMFLSSFNALRNQMIDNQTIVTLCDTKSTGYHSDNFTANSTFVLANNKPRNTIGSFFKLDQPIELKGQALVEAIQNPDCGWFYRADAATFHDIPGSPIAYWASDAVLAAFRQGTPLDFIGHPRVGIQTGENARFLRLWWEPNRNTCKFDCSSVEECVSSQATWFPYNKGGDYRKWYGNNDYVINWQNDGNLIINNAEADGRKVMNLPQAVKFLPSVTWSKISSGNIAFRYKPFGHLFDVAGTSIFSSERSLAYLQGAANSSVILKIASLLSPTLNFEVGQIATYPILAGIPSQETSVIQAVEELRALSKADWDTQETSWDFKRNPLL